MVESHLLLIEFPGLLCLIFLFIFIIVANIFCTTILIKLISEHSKILNLLLNNEIAINEPTTIVTNSENIYKDNKISESLENITLMMEKFMWFYVTNNNKSFKNLKSGK